MSRMKSTLKHVIIKRLVSDKPLLLKYTKGRCKVPSGKFGEKYRAELRTLVLTRLLTLVVFLDRAKMANILDRVPRLFTKDSSVKSTREMCVQICRNFLASEGDIIKHLSRVGLKVFYVQKPIDEIDFLIHNLASDIRDGVRLARMTELLSNSEPKSLLLSLRLPAVSRLQKLHNVELVLDALHGIGVPNTEDVAAHHIVDGYQDQVLKLLWSVLAQCGLGVIVDEALVEAEIENVTHSNSFRTVHREYGNGVVAVAGDDNPPESKPEAKFKSLLLRWCSAVCKTFSIQVSDFTTSFASGTVLCVLIHFYHPELLRIQEIQRIDYEHDSENKQIATERRNVALAVERMAELGGIPNLISPMDSRNPPDERTIILCTAYLCSRLMESSKEILACISIQLWYRKQKRVDALKLKIEAARVIVAVWKQNKSNYYEAQSRKYGNSVTVIERFYFNTKAALRRVQLERHSKERKGDAATKIQAAVRKFMVVSIIGPHIQEIRAAKVVQTNWRRFVARCKLEQAKLERDGAILVQTLWRRHSCETNYNETIVRVLYAQACLRRSLVQKSLRAERLAATKLQSVVRTYMVQIFYQIDLLDIIISQSIVRGRIARKKRNRRERAVVEVQSFGRIVLAKIEFHSRFRALETLQRFGRLAITTLESNREFSIILAQSIVRGTIARRERRRRAGAVLSVQSFGRMVLAQNKRNLRADAVITIQRAHRRHEAHKLFSLRLEAVSTLTRFGRIVVAKSALSKKRIFLQEMTATKEFASARLMQAAARRFLQTKKFEEHRSSAVEIQCFVRRTMAKGLRLRRSDAVYTLQKFGYMAVAKLAVRTMRLIVEKRHAVREAAAVMMQSAARGFLQRTRFEEDRCVQSAVRIQCFVRRILAMKTFIKAHTVHTVEKEDDAAVTIQCSVRKFAAYRKFQIMYLRHLGSIIVQAWWRSLFWSAVFSKKKESATKIQSIFRGSKERKHLLIEHSNAAKIQSIVRSLQAQVYYKTAKHSITTLQSLIRQKLAQGEAASRHFASMRIQSAARMHLARRHFERELAAITIQGTLRVHSARLRVSCLKRSAMVLVGFGRIAVAKSMKVQRKLDRDDALKQLSAATKMQSSVRMYLAQKYTMRELAATNMQSVVRARIARSKFLHLKKNALLVVNFGQVAVAKLKVRQKRAEEEAEMRVFAATKMQTFSRMCFAREQFRKVVAARLIQKVVRADMARSRFSNLKTSAAVLISFGRIALAKLTAVKRKRYLEQTNEIERKASSKIQLVVRQFLREKHLQHIREKASILIQTACKGFLAHLCCISIQTWWRATSLSRSYGQKRKAALTLQAIVRGQAARSIIGRQSVAANAIQEQWRHFQQSQRIRQQYLKSITAIQSWVRMRNTKRVFENKVVAIAKMQALVRGAVARTETNTLLSSATRLQAIWRGRFCLGEYERALRAIKRTQSLARMALARKAYIDHLRAATVLQSFVRGAVLRIKIADKTRSAIAIQCCWRCFKTRIVYLSDMLDIILVQSLARKYLAARTAQQRYWSAIVLQKKFRQTMAVKEAKKKRDKKLLKQASATKVQSQWRRFICMVRYHTDLIDIIESQSVVRRWLAKRLFSSQVSKIITVQCLFRRKIATKTLRLLIVKFIVDNEEIAAIRIQSAVRACLARTFTQHLYLKHLGSIILQAWWRKMIGAAVFASKKKSATKIQSFVRGSNVRQELIVKAIGAIKIQSVVRSFISQVQYQMDCLDIIVVQSIVRRRLSKIEKERKLSACHTLQNFTRFCLRREMNARVHAAIAIQSFIRSFEVKKLACQKQSSIAVIQHFFRNTIRKIVQSREKLKREHSAVRIQSALRTMIARNALISTMTRIACARDIQRIWRGLLARSAFNDTVAACVLIQAFIRGHNQRSLQFKMALKATSIQGRWRSHKLQLDLQRKLNAAVVLQSAARSRKCKENFQCSIFAAVKIQAAVRRFTCRQKTVSYLLHVVQIQKTWRSKRDRRSFQNKLRAAVNLQRNVRSILSVRRAQQILRRCLEGIVLLQSIARKRTGQKAASVLRLSRAASKLADAEIKAAICIQTIFRAKAATLMVHAMIEARYQLRFRLEKAATTLQSCARRMLTKKSCIFLGSLHLCRKENDSCVLIQSLARRFLAYKRKQNIELKHLGSIILQAWWRCSKLSKIYKTQTQGVLKLQSLVRGQSVRSRLERVSASALAIQNCWITYRSRRNAEAQVHCAIAIQSAVRGYLAMEHASRKLSATLQLQAYGRGLAARRYWRARQIHSIAIQSAWRRFWTQASYQRLVECAIRTQCFARRRLVQLAVQRGSRSAVILQTTFRRLRCSLKLCRWKLASVYIQRVFRGYRGRKIYRRNKAATMIQKTWRCFKVHVEYMLTLLDIIAAQRMARKYLGMKKLEKGEAAVKRLQSMYRGSATRMAFETTILGFTKIQAISRGALVRKMAHHRHTAARLIQRNVRGLLARIDLEVNIFAAREIQRVWRGFAASIDALYRILMIFRIQSVVRMYIAKKDISERRHLLLAERAEIVFVNKMTKKIQTIYRDYRFRLRCAVHAVLLQKMVRGMIAKRRATKAFDGIVKLQSLLRGGMARKKSSRAVGLMAMRLAHATSRALLNPRMKLGSRTQRALLELQTSRRLTEIMEAAKLLEMSTRLSKACCVAFANARAPCILYALISQCNRSLPHIEILFFVVATLRNVAAHDDLLSAVATPKSADVFLDLIQMFRDKDAIFCEALPLLNRVVHFDSDLKAISSSSENVKRLKHVLKRSSPMTSKSHEASKVGSSKSNAFHLDRLQCTQMLRSLLRYLEHSRRYKG